MCFSTTASFTAAAALGVAGAISLKKITDRSQFMFAAIPLLFAIQQFCEGLVWIALGSPEYTYLRTPMTYIFLFFAQMLWTTWIPLSILHIEEDPFRKKILSWISAAGISVSLLLAYRLIFYSVHAEISNHHIDYLIESPQFIKIVSSILYVIAIIFPPFVSSIRRMWIVGVFQLAGLLVTKIFYEQYLISVWCFFAAALSIMIISIMQVLQNSSVRFKPSNMSHIHN